MENWSYKINFSKTFKKKNSFHVLLDFVQLEQWLVEEEATLIFERCMVKRHTVKV